MFRSPCALLVAALMSYGCVNAKVTDTNSQQQIAEVGAQTAFGSNNTTITYFCTDQEPRSVKAVVGQATVIVPNAGTISFQNVSRNNAFDPWPANARISVTSGGNTYTGAVDDVELLDGSAFGVGAIGAKCANTTGCDSVGQFEGAEIRINWLMAAGTEVCD